MQGVSKWRVAKVSAAHSSSSTVKNVLLVGVAAGCVVLGWATDGSGTDGTAGQTVAPATQVQVQGPYVPYNYQPLQLDTDPPLYLDVPTHVVDRTTKTTVKTGKGGTTTSTTVTTKDGNVTTAVTTTSGPKGTSRSVSRTVKGG